MTQNRFYASGAVPTTLAAAAANSGNISVAATTGWPSSYPFTLLIDWGSFIAGATQEAVSVTSAPTGTGPYTVPCTRGIDGTTAGTHLAGAVVVHGVSAQDFNDSALHVNGFTQGMAPSGLTGATAASRYVGGTVSGAPASGTFAAGDYAIDQTGKVQVCTVAGTPGTWVQAGSQIDGTAADFLAEGAGSAGSSSLVAAADHRHPYNAQQSLVCAPSGALAETFPRIGSSVLGGAALTSGTLFVVGIPLPAGITVANINIGIFTVSGTLTHGWLVLLDSARVVKAVSADQTSGTFAGGAVLTKAMAVSYLIPAAGMYYIGICNVTVGSGCTVFSPSNGSSTLYGFAPVSAGSSSTSQTTPPVTGTTMAAISSAGSSPFWGYVS